VVCTMMGDVWLVTGLDNSEVTWKRYATGLNQALGVCVHDDQIYVVGRDRITRLHDLNDDGEADYYENFCDTFPASTGGHDFTVGLQRDGSGNFYTVTAKGVIRVSPDGKQTTTIATGLRNANGLGVSQDGILLTSTNEGDWTPASAVMEVREGDFYGRRAATDQTISPPLCYLPRGIDNSSGGQIFVEGNSNWNTIAGSIVHTSFGAGTWGLILRDDTGDRAQGAFVPMPGDFGSGAHRARFSPVDGQLYLTGSDGWGNYSVTDGSLDRIRYTGGPMNLPVSWKAHANGLHVTLSDPIAPSSAQVSSTLIQQWNYEYSPGYGSREYSVKDPYTAGHDTVEVASVQVLDDRTLFFEIPTIIPVKQMHLVSRLTDAQGTSFVLELFPTLLSLAKPFPFSGMSPPLTDKPTDLTLRVRYAKASQQKGAKIPKASPAGREVIIDMVAGLRFSLTEVQADPKERLTFVITNKDPMPHNLVLLQPGSQQKVGEAATAMLTHPDAFEKHYVPDLNEVLWHTPVMEHNAWRSLRFSFNAPEEPGVYPYICTFPGHWKIMKGELIVE
ncbi:MAG: plastocyanin/azurin family copper-binding protein, partial [Verrucomicrobiota bacterium]